MLHCQTCHHNQIDWDSFRMILEGQYHTRTYWYVSVAWLNPSITLDTFLVWFSHMDLENDFFWSVHLLRSWCRAAISDTVTIVSHTLRKINSIHAASQAEPRQDIYGVLHYTAGSLMGDRMRAPRTTKPRRSYTKRISAARISHPVSNRFHGTNGMNRWK